MAWTRFMDMHSGGGAKESPYEHIYIEAAQDEAKVIFYNRFGHNPERVTCTCCGDDYSIAESPSLAQASGYDRGCKSLDTPRDPVTGRYEQPDDSWWREHYYVEPEDEAEAAERGWAVGRALGLQGAYRTVEQYLEDSTVLVIGADEIKPGERTGDVPEQGYVWAG